MFFPYIMGGVSDINLNMLLQNKINFFDTVIQETCLAINNYKSLKIHTSSELNTCIAELNLLYDDLSIIKNKIDNNKETDSTIFDLQLINNKLSLVIKKYGTRSIKNMLKITLGSEYIDTHFLNNDKFNLLDKLFNPVMYKLFPKTSKCAPINDSKSKILEDMRIADTALTLDGFNIETNIESIHYKLNGIKIVFQDHVNNQCLIVYGILDNVLLQYCMNNSYINTKYQSLLQSTPDDEIFKESRFQEFINSLSLKDYLIQSVNEIYDKYIGYLNNVKAIKNKSLTKIISDFLKHDFLNKRLTIIQLLLYSDNNENQYLAYLLYDTMNLDDNVKVDNDEQSMLYDTLPWTIKYKFKGAMKQTIEYTNELLNTDSSNKVPLEQQICLLKVDNNVKEKAMIKLKEVKSKADDSGTKARHYLDGLLKIPFQIYKKEPVMEIMEKSNYIFNRFMENPEIKTYLIQTLKKDNLVGMEIFKHLSSLGNLLKVGDAKSFIQLIRSGLDKYRKTELYDIVFILQNVLEEHDIKYQQEEETLYFLTTQTATKITLKEKIFDLIDIYLRHKKHDYCEIIKRINLFSDRENKMYNDYFSIKNNCLEINNFLTSVKNQLDKSAYGHDDAKRQVERIVGQWITGKDKGYCLGFEGPPGVGKTSLAKYGLANCLKDENGNSRPFAFIAIGGSSNGSTLEGHNYTYVGSTWGRIVDILMETKCMNPIIFIDEIDKVSRTESGREIISILTHLVDPTQNDKIQDKYFSNINLDLSKALFVFSYNDVDLIDRILLDRIHRIKFDSLTLEDKLVICNNYMIPEILETIGQVNNIYFSTEVLTFLIEKYTCESGVRKIKELLTMIVGEINLEILKMENEELELPYFVSCHDVENKFLKKRHKAKIMTRHSEPIVGVINGLWANSLGKGGIIPIQVSFFPSNNFMELKLTGMQGDVMKESMNVSKTIAWNLTSREKQEELIKYFESTKNQGIHIHCPEGAVPKDGPSAGTAITIAIYSLLNNKKIRHDFAITGEINLQNNVTIIGGLDLKFLGGINAGIKTFLFPAENLFDYNLFMEKYENDKIIDGIVFKEVSKVEEALKEFLIDE